MHIGFVYPDVPTWPKFRWAADAAANLGHEVSRIHSIPDLYAADEYCDLILFQQNSAGLCQADIIAFLCHKRKSLAVQWWFDLIVRDPAKPLAEQEQVKDKLDLMLFRAFDRVLVKEKSWIGEYQKLGINASYMDQACPSWMPACEHREKPEFDVLVAGRWGSDDYGQRRRDVNTLVDAGFKVAWAGQAEDGCPPGVTPLTWVPVDKLPEYASRARVVLAVDYRHDVEGYWSDRTYLFCGMGASVVRRQTPGVPNCGYAEYPTDHELPWLAKVCGLIYNAHRAGDSARERVMSAHTYEHRISEIIALCKNPLNQTSSNVPNVAAKSA